jgi:DNA processing protein
LNERWYWLAWQWVLPGQAKVVYELVNYFGSAQGAWEAQEKHLSRIPQISGERAARITQRKSKVPLGGLAEKLQKLNMDFCCFNESGYPRQLRSIFDPPPVIFFRGRLLSADELTVAIVGARKPTHYGQLVAEKLAKDLAGVGVAVVSGMAKGIDTAAHKGALTGNGRTLAVLGCGLDIIYPRENKKLMEQIAETGAVISEFPPGSPPEAWHFPARNRIISGLSIGTVVVEASEKSGALITAGYALEQGRDVMAVPGNVVSKLSRGPNRLLKQGARLVEGASDILDELGLEKLFPLPEKEEGPALKISKEEETLYRLLSLEPMALDQLIVKSGLSPQMVMAALMYLELKGFTKQLPGKQYIRTGPDRPD